MFELNLIKDKARARQRRRVIFLSITSICFLAALCSLFVVSIYLKELNETNDLAKQAQTKEAELNAKKAENDRNEPVFKLRRNEVIKAWNEDIDFLGKRPYYSPVLKALYAEKPGAKYWFSSILILTLGQPQQSAATGTPNTPKTPKMMMPRGLRISGMIAIVESDVRTEQAMTRWDERMNERDGFVSLVGPARSRLATATGGGQGGSGQGGGEGSRWNEFTIESSAVGGNYGP
ncbi:MAG: hypothetical protein IT461_08835 [Planctomycetes bacterium]|jgi:hypothetical protein|nr:hypothetical protein [Planctomycetota bacterium]